MGEVSRLGERAAQMAQPRTLLPTSPNLTLACRLRPLLVSLAAEVAALQDWLLKHVAWMDGELAKEQPPGPPPAGRR